jgi:hypothetical protein
MTKDFFKKQEWKDKVECKLFEKNQIIRRKLDGLLAMKKNKRFEWYYREEFEDRSIKINVDIGTQSSHEGINEKCSNKKIG